MDDDEPKTSRLTRAVDTKAAMVTSRIVTFTVPFLLAVFAWIGQTYYSNVREDGKTTLGKIDALAQAVNSANMQFATQVINVQGQLNVLAGHVNDVSKTQEDRMNGVSSMLQKANDKIDDLQKQFWQLQTPAKK